MTEHPTYDRPVLHADGSHRGMNAGWGPPEPAGLLAAAPTTWQGLQPGRSKGVDSSHWNGIVNPRLGMVHYGIEWWAHKATEGTSYIDPTFKLAQAQMRAAGIKYRIWYHFPLNNQSIKDQVDHFLRTVGPLQVGEAAKLDDEAAVGLGSLTIAQAREWHERVETATGRPTVQYTGGYVRNPIDPQYHWDAAILREGLHGHRPNIFASYNPEDRARANARGRAWDVWQQSSSGVLPGIQSGGIGVIDLDRVDFPSAYDAACGYTDQPIPVPPPDPPPTPPPTPPPSQEDLEMMIHSTGIVPVYDTTDKNNPDGTFKVGAGPPKGSRSPTIAPGRTRAIVLITPVAVSGAGHLRISGNGVRPDYSGPQWEAGHPPMPVEMMVELNPAGAIDIWADGESESECHVIIVLRYVNP